MLHSNRLREPPKKYYEAPTATVSRTHDHLPPNPRPSGLPRSTSSHSGGKLGTLASSRPLAHQQTSLRPPFHHARTASEDVPLIFDTLPRTKSSPTMNNFAPTLTVSETTHLPWDVESDTVFGIAVPEKRRPNRTPELPAQLIPELQALASYSSRQRPVPPSSISTISSPSTRFTESPAPWSASTATTTPVSWPSSSPAMVQASVPAKKIDYKSKTVPQPREPRSRLPKLPVLRNDILGQTATVAPEPNQQPTAAERRMRPRKKSLLDSPAPTPPPRTSSAKRSDRGGSKSGTSSIDETLSRAGISTAPSSTGPDASPLASRAVADIGHIGSSLRVPTTNITHTNLQQSIKVAPPRPSREGTTDLGESRPAVMNDHKAGFSNKHRQLLASAFEDATPHRALSPSAPSSDGEGSKPGPQRSPSKLGKLSRLGMFTRRGANVSKSEVEKSPKKLQRRGPAAGTGHEGYGKYAKRGRKASFESSATRSDSEQSVSSVKIAPLVSSSRKNSTSTARRNRSSQSDLDEFAASRLKPVVMRGGSQTSVDHADASSEHTRNYGNTRVIPQSAGLPGVGSDAGTGGASAAVRSPLRDVTNSRRQSPAMSESVPRVTLRRSQKFGPGQDLFRMSSPIRTGNLGATSYASSHATSQSSLPPSSAALSVNAGDAPYTRPEHMRPLERKSRKHWWNPFRRRQPDIYPPEPAQPPARGPAAMAVSIATGPAPRSIPYYAVMESEGENSTAEAIGEYLSQAVESPPESPHLLATQVEDAVSWRRTESILLPTAPVWEQNMPPPSAAKPEAETEQLVDTTLKQPRLAQVGRIPKVVNRSEREHKPSRRSFSQPFAKKPSPQALSTEGPFSQENDGDRPQLEIHTDILPSRPFPDFEGFSAKPASAPARSAFTEARPMEYTYSTTPLLVSKHGSDVSGSSSSDGVISVIGPSLIPSHRERELRAQIPALKIASGLPGDDEIWNEFDDFLDHVMSPSKSKKANALRHASSKQKATPANLSPVIGGGAARSSKGKMPVIDPRKATLDLSLPTSLTPPVVFPSPSLLSDKSVSEEIRLRRSRIVSALHSSMDPSSPFSMREFLKDYSTKGRDSGALSERLSISPAAGYLGLKTPTSAAVVEEPKIEHTHDENALLLDSAKRIKDPARQSELHYASLEVARWLSFGRVLFSPAHEEVHTLAERNVLVIDGLGNEDWSIYCAVTYEDQKAIIYDLKEDSMFGLSQTSRDSAHTPANHHRRAVPSLSDRFPFHSAFFSAIVLRFPPAMSEGKMRNIISECRRVLVPGGHLEIMLLDLDIVNMGVQTRRAVREMKMRMTEVKPDVDLRPTIDNFQSLLGGRGFTGLSRCIVGVPVTGRPTGSTDSPSSSRSSGGSTGYGRRTSSSSFQQERSIPPHKGRNFSLNDLVADHSESADAKIGRMVSRTARSWWQHCYEADVLGADDSKSVFSDKRVMQECKSRASSFKLLIAYAQRPVFEGKRRTMSENSVSKLATAGSQRRMGPAS